MEMIFFSWFPLADLTSPLSTKSYTLQNIHQNGNSPSTKKEKNNNPSKTPQRLASPLTHSDLETKNNPQKRKYILKNQTKEEKRKREES